MSWIRQLSLSGAINSGRKEYAGVVVLFSFCFSVFGNRICFGNCFILLSFSCSLLRICENVLQVRLEFLGKTRDDFICVVNLFGF